MNPLIEALKGMQEEEGPPPPPPSNDGDDLFNCLVLVGIAVAIIILGALAISNDSMANNCFSSNYRSTHHSVCKWVK